MCTGSIRLAVPEMAEHASLNRGTTVGQDCHCELHKDAQKKRQGTPRPNCYLTRLSISIPREGRGGVKMILAGFADSLAAFIIIAWRTLLTFAELT